MSPWEEVEKDPEFSTLAPQDKAALFDDWHRTTVEEFHKDLDPEQIDSAGMRGFLASGQAKRRELLGEPVAPEQAVKEFDQSLQARSKAQQQTLNDYDELEKSRFALKDAAMARGVTSSEDRGMPMNPRVAAILDKPQQEAQAKLDELSSRFTPEIEKQAKEARGALRGERPAAVLGSDIYTDPSLVLDKEKYRQAIQSTNASPEAKLLALADYNTRRDDFAKKALNTFNVAGESPVPGMTSFSKWESEQPADMRAKTPEAKALDYMRAMQDRSGFRKLVSAVGTGAIQGGADVAGQGIGLAAMASGSDALAKKAGEVEQGTQALSDVQKLEGDNTATGATTLGGLSRLGVGMAPAIGAGVLTGGSLPAAALAAGAQTAGAQFPTTYNAMIEQGKTPEEALSASRGAAVLSGGITAALTALGGYNGVEALVRRGGMEAARSKLKSVLLTGPLKEIAEELPDELASQIIESSLTNPDKPVSQVVDEFMAKAPDLALQVGLLGGAGEAFSKQGAPATPAVPAEQQRTPVNSAGLGRTVGEVIAEADALKAKAQQQAVESGSPLLAQAIAENVAAPTPEAQTEETGETAEPSETQEPGAAGQTTEPLSDTEVKVATERVSPITPETDPAEIHRKRNAETESLIVRDAEGDVDRAATKAKRDAAAKEAGMTRDEWEDAQAALNVKAKEDFFNSLNEGDTLEWTDANGKPATGKVEIQLNGKKVVRNTTEGSAGQDYLYDSRAGVFGTHADSLKVIPKGRKASSPTDTAEAAAPLEQGGSNQHAGESRTPAEGSIPTLTGDTVSTSDIPSTGEIQPAPRTALRPPLPVILYEELKDLGYSLSQIRALSLQEAEDLAQRQIRPTAQTDEATTPTTKPAEEKPDRGTAQAGPNREAGAARERALERELIGEEKAQRGDERPVSDDKAPVTQGDFVTWQDENGAMREGVLTKASAGRGSLGEPMSEVTLEDSQVVQVPRRELQPLMASLRRDGSNGPVLPSSDEYLKTVKLTGRSESDIQQFFRDFIAFRNLNSSPFLGPVEFGSSRSPAAYLGRDGRVTIHLGIPEGGNAFTRNGSEELVKKRLADLVDEEIIHAADFVALSKAWDAAGRPNSINQFVHDKTQAVLSELASTYPSLSTKDQAVLTALLNASDSLYSQQSTTRSFEEWMGHLQKDNQQAIPVLNELVRQLVQLHQTGDITETGWKRIAGALSEWLKRLLKILNVGSQKAREGVFGDILKQRVAQTEEQLETLTSEKPKASSRGNPVQASRAEAIESLRGHLGKEVSVGVSAVDAINGAAELQGDVPGVQKAWVGTSDEFLADEGLRKAFPQVNQAMTSPDSSRFEGLFSGGRAFVFTDNVGIYEGDIELAAQEGMPPGQAAVQRVITHEALVHRGFYALDKPTRQALLRWGEQNIYEGEMDAKAEEYGVGANWRSDVGSREWLMEEIMAKMIERLKAPPKSGPLKQLWDILASLWRKLTGRSREVTLKDIHDVAKLLRTALELAENNVQTRDGMPIKVEVAKPSMAGERGSTIYKSTWLDIRGNRVEVLKNPSKREIDGMRDPSGMVGFLLLPDGSKLVFDRSHALHGEVATQMKLNRDDLITGLLYRDAAVLTDAMAPKFKGKASTIKTVAEAFRFKPREVFSYDESINGSWLDAQEPSDVDETHPSIRPTYTSPLDQTLANTAKAVRLMRDGPPAVPVNLQEVYRKAQVGKSSAMVSLDDMFAEAKKTHPDLTEAEFGQQVQALYDDNGAYIEPAESPTVMREAGEKYNVRMLGVPASYVMVLDGGPARASMRPEQDAEYMAAVESGDVAKQQAMVDAAAKAAGYTVEMFHGTPNGVFTSFSPTSKGKLTGAKSATKGYFGVDNPDVAKQYSSLLTEAEIKRQVAISEKLDELYSELIKLERTGLGRGEKAEFVNSKISEIEKSLGDSVEQATGRNVEVDYMGTRIRPYMPPKAVVMKLFAKLKNPLKADFRGKEFRDKTYADLLDEAQSKGHDGATFSKTYDDPLGGNSSHTVHVVFKPNQIKSADPITRDANGNVIPLSQRFNTESNDIRFSLAPETASRLNRVVEAAQTASGDITESVQTPIKDRPVHTFAQQSGEARVDAAVQIVDALEAEGTPKEELVDKLNSYELQKQLGIEKDPDMLSILMAEAMRRGAPGAFDAYEVTRERAGRALGSGVMIHSHPRYQHLFVLNGIKKEHQQQANDIAEANADIKDREIKKLVAESGRTADQELADGAMESAFREGEEALSAENKPLWQKIKDRITRIGFALQKLAGMEAKNSAGAKPSASLAGVVTPAELAAMDSMTAEQLRAFIDKEQKELASDLKKMLGKGPKAKANPDARRIATLVNRLSEQLGVPTDITSAVEALTASQDSLKSQFEQSIVDSLVGKVRSAITPKKAPSKNLNSVIKQITRILADNLNLPKATGPTESLGEKAIDAFGRVRNNEQLIREAWEKAREQIRATLAKRATEGLEGLTEEEAADIEQQLDGQLAAIAAEVPAHLWARGQAFSVLRDALAETAFDNNEKIMDNPEGALKAAQGKINEAVEKVGNVDPARWGSNQPYIIAAFNQLVADLRVAKAKSNARRRATQRAGVFSPAETETFNRLMDSARKRSGDKTPLLPENISWGKLFSSSPQSQEAKAKAMMEYMKADPVLSNLTAAEQQELADMFAKQWEAKRTALTEAKVAAVLKRRHATAKGKEAVKGAIPKFIQAINRGELNNDIIAQDIAEKFGFQKLTDAENKKLETLAKELQQPDIPVHERRAKTDEIVKIIARKTGLSTAEILSAWWVTSVLSGPRTIFTIGMAFLSGGFEVFTHAMATVINAHLQGRRSEGTDAAMQSITNYFKSYPRAVQLAWQYVRTGDKNLLADSDPAFMQFFDTGRNNPQSIGWRMTQSKNPATRMLGRFMHFFEKMLTAGDLFNSTITRHGMLPVAMFLNSKTYEKARVASETDLANARKEVLAKWWADKKPQTWQEQALVTRQSIDLIEAKLAKYANVLEDANFVAAQGAMTLNPEGLGGKGYRAIRGIANRAETSSAKAVKNADKLKAEEVGALNKKTQQAIAFLYHFATHQMLNLGGLRFARFAGNKLNQSLGFVPLLGLARLYEKDYAGQIKSQAIIKNQVIGAILSMVGIIILKAVSDEPDDEKRGWGIEGSWAGLSADKIKQLMAAGRKQNSIHFGEHTFNYSNWPISSVLAAFGAMADRIKYNPKDWKEATSPEVAYTGLWAAMTSTFDTTALSQLSEILGSNVHSRDPVDASIKKVSRVFGNFAGGFIPRVFKDADLLQDGKLRKYEGWENFAKEVPVYRRYVGGPLLDIFGKQVEVSRTPWSREYLAQPEAKEYRLLGQLGSNGLWLTPADPANRRVGRGKRSREMTDAEQKRFVTIVGNNYRDLVLKHGERLTKMPHENAKELMGKLSAAARDRAERAALVAPTTQN